MSNPNDCPACGQPMPQPKNEWLTTRRVIDEYGFDPEQHILSLKSKLAQTTVVGETHLVRVWLKESVEAFHP